MEMESVLEEIRLVRADVKELRGELQRYKGFVGGVAWSLSALTALVGFLWGTLSSHG